MSLKATGFFHVTNNEENEMENTNNVTVKFFFYTVNGDINCSVRVRTGDRTEKISGREFKLGRQHGLYRNEDVVSVNLTGTLVSSKDGYVTAASDDGTPYRVKANSQRITLIVNDYEAAKLILNTTRNRGVETPISNNRISWLEVSGVQATLSLPRAGVKGDTAGFILRNASDIRLHTSEPNQATRRAIMDAFGEDVQVVGRTYSQKTRNVYTEASNAGRPRLNHRPVLNGKV